VAPLHRLRGRVCGIIGAGRIGTATALRARALGLDVVFYDPYAPDGRDKSLGIRRAETLAELMRQSHLLSVHCPLTAETRHMINDETLALLSPGAIVVNTARGAVVDAAAVLRAISRSSRARSAYLESPLRLLHGGRSAGHARQRQPECAASPARTGRSQRGELIEGRTVRFGWTGRISFLILATSGMRTPFEYVLIPFR
jgi:hypothetical protein